MTDEIERAIRPSSQSDDCGADEVKELPRPRKSTAKFKSGGEERLKKCSTVEISEVGGAASNLLQAATYT